VTSSSATRHDVRSRQDRWSSVWKSNSHMAQLTYGQSGAAQQASYRPSSARLSFRQPGKTTSIEFDDIRSQDSTTLPAIIQFRSLRVALLAGKCRHLSMRLFILGWLGRNPEKQFACRTTLKKQLQRIATVWEVLATPNAALLDKGVIRNCVSRGCGVACATAEASRCG
jgi:hypothetical protein